MVAEKQIKIALNCFKLLVVLSPFFLLISLLFYDYTINYDNAREDATHLFRNYCSKNKLDYLDFNGPIDGDFNKDDDPYYFYWYLQNKKYVEVTVWNSVDLSINVFN